MGGWHGRLHAWLYWCCTGTPFTAHVKTRRFYSQLQLQKHCTGVEGGGQTGPAVLLYSCVKHPVTPMRKHVDFSGVFGKANDARVTLVSTSAHPLTLHNKARVLNSRPLADMKGRHPGLIPRLRLGLDVTVRPSTSTFKFTRRLITGDSRLHPRCTEGWQVKASSASHDTRER